VRLSETKAVLVCLALLLPSTGSVNPRIPDAPAPGQTRFAEQPALAAIRARGVALFQSARYVEAGEAYRHGYEQAVKLGEPRSALRFLNDTGAALLAGFSYRDAVQVFRNARSLAEQLQDGEMSGVISLNLASLYLQMGSLKGALEETHRALRSLETAPGSRYRLEAFAQLAKLKAREGDFESALQFFSGAIREADAQGDIALKAPVLNQLGYEYLDRGRLNEAERAMTEAFRLRVLSRDASIGQSYRALGLLKLAQGDFDSAAVLLDRAIAAAERNPGRVPTWAAYHARGELRMAQHRLPEAVQDFRSALDLAKRWRLEILPADSVRLSAGVGLEQLYSSFIRAAGELCGVVRNESLAREAFEAAEDIRAATLRATTGHEANWRSRLPGDYRKTLAELRSARVALLRGQSSTEREHVEQLRKRLSEMETRAGRPAIAGDLDQPPHLLNSLSQVLRPSEALISFHLDDPYSYSWVVTRGSFSFHRLAGASQLRGQIAQFTRAIRRGSAEWLQSGERLYSELFGQSSARLRSKTHWLIAAGDALLGLPFSSLVIKQGAEGPVFLIEEHALTVVPGARFLALARRSNTADDSSGPFVGVSDAIYNTADSRSPRSPRQEVSLQLPRLAGSAGEVRACARALEPEETSMLLEGAKATRRSLVEALSREPSVIHFATHIVQSADDPPRQLIQLSLLPSGDPDYLGAEEVAGWRLAKPAIVVLSGCASGKPEAQPQVYSLLASPPAPEPPADLALVGLARAWLAAGARSVVVSYWPTPDDTGVLFLSFYKHLRESNGTDPAAALARAQVDMLRSRTWRSVPKYWAAYTIVGRG
jgi:CHAT domain-containing protein/tetratricopeptide (TPR) repeat protein